METVLQEHDALIIAAAQGILRRTESAVRDASAGADAIEGYSHGRVAEACHAAVDAISNALIALKVHLNDPTAAGVLARDKVTPLASVRADR